MNIKEGQRGVTGSEEQYPPWVVLHVPHDSTDIPTEIRSQFLLDDGELGEEVTRMTDHHTFALFADHDSIELAVRAPVCRLVVDVERFEDDRQERMAGRGMGAIYSVTSGLKPLRRQLSEAEREALLHAYYRPHHARLEAAVKNAVDRFGRCLVIDCHSFPREPLPYEDASLARPEICIGTDDFHTAPDLADAFQNAFARTGWTVALNQPFAGALVPMSRYGKDARVGAVMVEMNRVLYLNESDGTRSSDFADVARRVRASCRQAIAHYCASHASRDSTQQSAL